MNTTVKISEEARDKLKSMAALNKMSLKDFIESLTEKELDKLDPAVRELIEKDN